VKNHSRNTKDVVKYSGLCSSLSLHPVNTFIKMFSHLMTGVQILQGILYRGPRGIMGYYVKVLMHTVFLL